MRRKAAQKKLRKFTFEINPMNVRQFFSKKDQQRIIDTIRANEAKTSGEIRVHLTLHCDEDVMDSAAYWFDKLKMQKTAKRNGVLFFIAVEDRRFAVIGDAGIHRCVPPTFWDDIQRIVLRRFHHENFIEGIIAGICLTGEQLQHFFPRQVDDRNELPDNISFG